MAKTLKFMKCVFFTHQQFNLDKIHIPTQSLYIEEDVEIRNPNDLENHINRVINDIYNNLNRGNQGSPIKIPAPIFALIGRKLDYDRSIFDGEIIKTPYKTPFVYGKETITPNQNGSLAIVSYFKSFFKSGLGEEPKDEDNYKRSLAVSYKFKGRLRVIIYVPYMTNKYKYVTNFTDIMNSSKFFYSLITNDNFLNFKKTTMVTYDELKKKYKNLSDKTIYILLDILKNEDKKKFGFYEDLMKLCSEGGCIADEGEDFARMLPPYVTDDEGANNENAIKQSPFMPNKCLAQTYGYIKNVKNATNHNKDLPIFLKTYAMKEIRESLEKYIEVSDKMAKDKNTDINPDEISSYKSPVDLIIAIINKYIRNYYSTNLNDESKDDIPLNHYSKNYSRNIIYELSLLQKFYPGIPEVILSLYLFDETMRSDKMIYMPWGKILVSGRNVLPFGELFEVNKTLFSFNNRFALTVNSNGIVYVYDRNSGHIIYFLNRNPTPNTQGMIFETTSIDIEFIDVNGNRKSKTVFTTSFIGDCDGCNDSPFNLILDNNGLIVIYANSFINATSKKFKSFLDKEIAYMNDLRTRGKGDGFNINNPRFVEITGQKIEEIPREEEYIWRT